MSEIIYLVALHSIGVTQKKLHIIFKNKRNYKFFFENINVDILRKFRFFEDQIQSILDRKKLLKLDFLQKKLDDRNVKIVTIYDRDYPELLKEIQNPPYFFYLRGKIDNTVKISVVGARKMTSYGDILIEKIIGDITKYFVIVSGGAAGCDSKSHEIALKKGTKTISVIGTGIDIDYPTGNKKLYDRIVDSGGGVISIFPIGEAGNPYNFPVRNEIVAGLSVGVVIIEASSKSGTLITANLALDNGKDIFAIPGDIFKSNSRGCNQLIKKGNAKLITCSDDILEEYIDINNKDYKKNNTQIIKFSDNLEKDIYNILLLESLNIDELSRKMGLDIATLSFKLSIMEINKVIKKGVGGKYILN